jgi:diaminopimelate epimerase
MTIETRGGTFRVGTATTSRGQERYLEGPVVTVFRGTLNVT